MVSSNSQGFFFFFVFVKSFLLFTKNNQGTDAASPSFDGERLRALTYQKLNEAITLLDEVAQVSQLPAGSVKVSRVCLGTCFSFVVVEKINRTWPFVFQPVL
jgi:hypothetical protein